MEIESLFSSTRWEILKTLSQAKLSPIELADRMKTTSANISQQLRLLELAGLVKSERTSNTDKGKPRIIYSISADTSFVILASPNFTDKKMLPLTAYHKFMMKAWFIDNIEYHPLIGELYFKIKDQLNNIKIISYKENSVYIVADTQKVHDSVKKLTDDFKKVRIVIQDSSEFNKKYDSKHLVLYDPKGIYSEINTEVGKYE
jgi:predicted transcriptional regulator